MTQLTHPTYHDRSSGRFHLAGIIPVAGYKSKFKFPWHDGLMPISVDYTAIERSVVECAAAGCHTIWIVCYRETQPLFRHRLGDWIIDPARGHSVIEKYVKYDRESWVRRVALYYVPIHPRDRKKRDCLPWSILYGMLRAHSVTKRISTWTTPDKYFVSFPYAVYSPYSARNCRKLIGSKKNFFLRHDGETVADGKYLSFSIDPEDFDKYQKIIKKEKVEGGVLPRDYTIKDVFQGADLSKATVVDTLRYYPLQTWGGYLDFMSSEFARRIRRPKNVLMNDAQLVGLDQEERQEMFSLELSDETEIENDEFEDFI